MRTAQRIRNHLENVRDDEFFCTQDLLYCGRRNAVDLTLSRMVRSGRIVRVARGLFMKKLSDLSSLKVADVAKAKAKAFGKKVSLHANYAALKIGLIRFDELHEPLNEILVYTSGCSSSFLFNGLRIRFVAASIRKFNLPDTNSGNVLKAAWHYCRQAEVTFDCGDAEKKQLKKEDIYSYSNGLGYCRRYRFYRYFLSRGRRIWYDYKVCDQDFVNRRISGNRRQFFMDYLRNFRPLLSYLKHAYVDGDPVERYNFKALVVRMPQWIVNFFYP